MKKKCTATKTTSGDQQVRRNQLYFDKFCFEKSILTHKSTEKIDLKHDKIIYQQRSLTVDSYFQVERKLRRRKPILMEKFSKYQDLPSNIKMNCQTYQTRVQSLKVT